MNGAPWEQPSLYAERSPATYASAISTPVLILHGEGDTNTFITNSQELYTALRLQGKTAQYVRYPREGHGFSEPRHRVDEMRRTLSWFDKHLAAPGDAPRYGVGDRVVHDNWELTVVTADARHYDGRDKKQERFLHVELVVRDCADRAIPFALRPADLRLTRGSGQHGVGPAGLPVRVLGSTVLAQGTGWALSFVPEEGARTVAAPVAVAFRIRPSAATYRLVVKDFPPITFDIPAEALLKEGFQEADVKAGIKIYGPKGCSNCTDGYKGRCGIYQVMPVTETLGRIIMEGGNAIDISEQATKEGVWDLRRAGLEKVRQGLTSIEEVNSVTIE